MRYILVSSSFNSGSSIPCRDELGLVSALSKPSISLEVCLCLEPGALSFSGGRIVAALCGAALPSSRGGGVAACTALRLICWKMLWKHRMVYWRTFSVLSSLVQLTSAMHAPCMGIRHENQGLGCLKLPLKLIWWNPAGLENIIYTSRFDLGFLICNFYQLRLFCDVLMWCS